MIRKIKLDYIPHPNPTFGEMWKWDFITLIPKSKKRKEIIKYCELLDWEKIGETATSEIKVVMKKMNIPEINPTLKFNKSLVEGILLADIKNRFHYMILYRLTTITKRDSKEAQELKIKNLFNTILFDVRRYKAIYEMILQFGGIKWIKDSDTLKIELDKLGDLAEVGKRFRLGHQYNPREIEAFTLIEKEFIELKKQGKKSTYRTLAFNHAHIHLDMYQDIEKQNFYKRFNNWHRKKSK
jgi:hypothetical protein